MLNLVSCKTDLEADYLLNRHPDAIQASMHRLQQFSIYSEPILRAMQRSRCRVCNRAWALSLYAK